MVIMFSDLDGNPFYYYFQSDESGIYDEDVQCFAEKLVFTDGVTTITPQYHGHCYSNSPSRIILELDPRDFLVYIQIWFGNAQDRPPALYMYTIETASEYGYPLETISADNSLDCITIISHSSVGVKNIEYFVEEGILVFHFSTFVNASSFNFTVLQLSSVYSNSRSPNNTLSLTGGELLTQPVDGLVNNAAIRIAAIDRMFLKDKTICTNRTNCFIYWSWDLALSYNGHSIQTTDSGISINPIQMVAEGKSIFLINRM